MESRPWEEDLELPLTLQRVVVMLPLTLGRLDREGRLPLARQRVVHRLARDQGDEGVGCRCILRLWLPQVQVH